MIYLDHTKGGFILGDQPTMKDLLATGLDEQGAETVLDFLERAKWREVRGGEDKQEEIAGKEGA